MLAFSTILDNSAISIGNLKEAHIFIRKLKPVEFIIEEENGDVHIKDADTKKVIDTFSALSARMVTTSDPDVIIWIGMNQRVLREVECGQLPNQDDIK